MTAPATKKDCAALVRPQWAATLSDLSDAMECEGDYAFNEDDEDEEYGLSKWLNEALSWERPEREELDNMYSFDDDEDDASPFFKLQLSWGGPSDEIRFYVDSECNVTRVAYHYMDWFDGASIDVTSVPEVKYLISELEDYCMFEVSQ